MPKMKNMMVNGGGLMRCCHQTLMVMAQENPKRKFKEGEVIDCAYEPKGNAQLVVDGKTIRWNNPDPQLDSRVH